MIRLEQCGHWAPPSIVIVCVKQNYITGPERIDKAEINNMKIDNGSTFDGDLLGSEAMPLAHQRGNDSSPSSSPSRGMRQLVMSCFLLSMTYHSFTGTLHRRNISAANRAAAGASLRGNLIPTEDAAAASSSLSDTSFLYNEEESARLSQTQSTLIEKNPPRYYRSIFHGAYKSLYKTNNSYSRMLSDSSQHADESETEQSDLAHELSIEVSFEDTYKILVFLGTVFIFGEIAGACGVPALVGQIIAGFLLGPPLAEYVPFPEAMVLLGDLGLILLLIEAGIELDIGLVKEAGIRPILIAVTGSILAFVTGMGLTLAQGQPIKSAIAAGACFAPTSLGVAANALSGGKALNTPVGQLIVASAVIDDVIGLIILSMLDVLVGENPPLYEYFIPIISACGYLVFLGAMAITGIRIPFCNWYIPGIPQFLEGRVLPRFKPEHRQYVAFALLWLLVMAYLPMMYYSKASHLTGAFLAGLSFSQVEGVHHTFITEAGSIMEWLLRIFFSASIGFQVPIRMFGNSSVVAWGFAFYVAVLGKLPVGLFAPKYNEKLPEDYPFNPYVRDVMITSVAMTCRGEFSFIIAAFSIGESLLDEELYSAIIFAVLLSSITSPIILTLVLRHYNRLAAKYLEQGQLDKSGVGGRGPLHVNIQIRSSVVPGMQTSIKNCVNSLGLFVIDQRSWSPRGLDVVVATELYAVDGKTKVDLNKALRRVGSLSEHPQPVAKVMEAEGEEGHVTFNDDEPTIIPEGEPVPTSELDFITQRCEEIRNALRSHPDLVDANVKVLQWVPMADALNKHSESARDVMIVGEATAALKNKETIDTLVDEKPSVRITKRSKMLSGPVSFQDAERERQADAESEAEEKVSATPLKPLEEGVSSEFQTMGQQQSEGLRRRPRRVRTVSSPAVGGLDLWKEDSKAQDAAIAGAPSPPVQYDLQSGMRYGMGRRQRVASDLGVIVENTPTIEERLGGIVRHPLNDSSPSDLGGILRHTVDSPGLFRRDSSS